MSAAAKPSSGFRHPSTLDVPQNILAGGEKSDTSAPVTDRVVARPDINPTLAPVSRARLRKALVDKKAWESLDKHDDPSRGLHVRLNGYELAIFQAAVELDGRSQQKLARALVREWAEEQLGINADEAEPNASAATQAEPTKAQANG